MSKVLLELVKKSIWPASLMVFGKAFGLYLAIKMFNLNLYVSNDVKSSQSVQFSFIDKNDTLLANSFSNGIMFTLILVSTVYLLSRFYSIQQAEKTPKTVVKLVKTNLLGWITGNKHNVVQLIVWLTFLLGTSVVVIRDTIALINYQWLGLLVTLLLLGILLVGIKVVETELSKIYPRKQYA